MREQVAIALVNKGWTLGQRGDSEPAIAVFDDVVARFGKASEPALRELVAKALVTNDAPAKVHDEFSFRNGATRRARGSASRPLRSI